MTLEDFGKVTDYVEEKLSKSEHRYDDEILGMYQLFLDNVTAGGDPEKGFALLKADLEELLCEADEPVEDNHETSPWIPVSEKLPVADDSDSHGRVITLKASGLVQIDYYYNVGDRHICWMRIPPYVHRVQSKINTE